MCRLLENGTWDECLRTLTATSVRSMLLSHEQHAGATLPQLRLRLDRGKATVQEAAYLRRMEQLDWLAGSGEVANE